MSRDVFVLHEGLGKINKRCILGLSREVKDNWTDRENDLNQIYVIEPNFFHLEAIFVGVRGIRGWGGWGDGDKGRGWG